MMNGICCSASKKYRGGGSGKEKWAKFVKKTSQGLTLA